MKALFRGSWLAAAVFALAAPCHAGTVTGSIDKPFQLTQSAVPGIGYLDYTFTDTGTNEVTLTVTSHLSAALNAYVQKDGLFFNYGPNTAAAPNASGLTFTQTVGSGDNAIANLTSAGDKNGSKADGDGWFDINFSFGSGAKALQNGQSITVVITGTGISAMDFFARSADKKQNDSGDSPEPNNYAGAHFAYTGASGSSSVWYGSNGEVHVNAVPEPSTAALALIAAGAFGALGLRRRRPASAD